MTTPVGCSSNVDGSAGTGTGTSGTGLTDTELRATPVPVSALELPLPTGAPRQLTRAAANLALGAPAMLARPGTTWRRTSLQLLKLAVAAFVGAR